MFEPYYQEKNITIYNGDCLEVMKEFDNKYFNLCLTDTPYGLDIKYDNYNDTSENWFNLFNNLIPELKRISLMSILPCCRFKYLEWIYKNWAPDWLICWYKVNTNYNSYIGFNVWEPLLVYGRNGKICMHDYFYAKTESMGKYGHPCPKSEQWAKWIISRASKENDLILDPFMGSGTVLRACKDLGRRCIGIEISKKYCDIAIRRLGQEVLAFDW